MEKDDITEYQELVVSKAIDELRIAADLSFDQYMVAKRYLEYVFWIAYSRSKRQLAHAKFVYQVCPKTGERLRKFDSVKTASNAMHIHKQCIAKAARNPRKIISAGYWWEYE